MFSESNKKSSACRTRFVLVRQVHHLYANTITPQVVCSYARRGGVIVVDDVGGVWRETGVFIGDDIQGKSSQEKQVNDVEKKLGVVEVTPQATPFVAE